MILTIIAPEYILGKAVLDFLSARHSEKAMACYARLDKTEWTESHGLLANMGVFEIVFDEVVIKEKAQKLKQKTENRGGESSRDEPGESDSDCRVTCQLHTPGVTISIDGSARIWWPVSLLNLIQGRTSYLRHGYSQPHLRKT